MWRKKIRTAIDAADVAVILISADFLASDFIANEELPHLFKGRREGRKRLFSLFVGHCAYKRFSEISEHQAINPPERPLSSLQETEVDEILASFVETIEDYSIELNKTVDSEGDGYDPEHPIPPHKSEQYYRNLPEVDYSSTRNKRLFSDCRVSIPKLAIALDTIRLDGFSFENCLIVGPALIFTPAMNISDTTFITAGDDKNSLFFQPVSKTWMTGVIRMSHLNIHYCRIENLAFVDLEGDLSRIFS